MTMTKNSNEHITCTYCDEEALPNTDPPVCALHKSMAQVKKASDELDTLKELYDDSPK